MTDEQLKTFLDEFINAESKDIKRERFVIYTRKGSTGAWLPIGYKQESASVANNYTEEGMTDVLGDKYSDIIDKDETIEMSSYHVNKNKSAFLDEAIKLATARLEDHMNDYELLFVYEWLQNEDGDMLGRKVTGVSLVLDNNGGQGFTMSDVKFKGIGKGEMGTVTYDTSTTPKGVEFEPATVPSV